MLKITNNKEANFIDRKFQYKLPQKRDSTLLVKRETFKFIRIRKSKQ